MLREQIDPQVTIVVVPHERFNVALESFDSIIEHTGQPYRLVYVDSNSPDYVYKGLMKRQKKYGFTWIRRDYYIQPNQARNIGLEHVHTPYMVFIDNDVLVTPCWLDNLLNCADETGAWLVGPLILEAGAEGNPVIHSTVAKANFDNDSGILLNQMTPHHKQSLESLPNKLERCPSELLEYHCILIKMEALVAIGGKIDEGLKNTRSHMDLCFSVRDAGGKIFFEPDSQIKYLRYYPIADKFDEEYVKFRYDDAATLESIRYFEKKWNVKLEPERFDIVSGGNKRRLLKSRKLPKISWSLQKILSSFMKHDNVRS